MARGSWYQAGVTKVQEEAGQAGGEERPRLLSVEIGDWPGLGGNVRLELGGWRTVLVGKNGAGKSLLMEGLSLAAEQAVIPPGIIEACPGYFQCELALSKEIRVAYEYRVFEEEAETEVESPAVERRTRVYSWTERCWRLPDGDELWRVADSQLVVGRGAGVLFRPGMGLLSASNPPVEIPDEVDGISRCLGGFRTVSAGVPRGGASRQEILVTGNRDARGMRRWLRGPSSTIQALARTIVNFFENDREAFDELATLLRQLGLARELSVKIYEDPQAGQNQGKWRDYASVLFDGVNIGFLSDGTQRIVDILLSVLRGSVRCLLIEEPETSVHPGLLAKLLALLDSYGYDRQIVVSTHSPQVVDWCKPEELRIIERIEGKTTARSLPDADLERVRRYLHEDGTFSEFVYEQGDL